MVAKLDELSLLVGNKGIDCMDHTLRCPRQDAIRAATPSSIPSTDHSTSRPGAGVVDPLPETAQLSPPEGIKPIGRSPRHVVETNMLERASLAIGDDSNSQRSFHWKSQKDESHKRAS